MWNVVLYDCNFWLNRTVSLSHHSWISPRDSPPTYWHWNPCSLCCDQIAFWICAFRDWIALTPSLFIPNFACYYEICCHPKSTVTRYLPEFLGKKFLADRTRAQLDIPVYGVIFHAQFEHGPVLVEFQLEMAAPLWIPTWKPNSADFGPRVGPLLDDQSWMLLGGDGAEAMWK